MGNAKWSGQPSYWPAPFSLCLLSSLLSPLTGHLVLMALWPAGWTFIASAPFPRSRPDWTQWDLLLSKHAENCDLNPVTCCCSVPFLVTWGSHQSVRTNSRGISLSPACFYYALVQGCRRQGGYPNGIFSFALRRHGHQIKGAVGTVEGRQTASIKISMHSLHCQKQDVGQDWFFGWSNRILPSFPWSAFYKTWNEGLFREGWSHRGSCCIRFQHLPIFPRC